MTARIRLILAVLGVAFLLPAAAASAQTVLQQPARALSLPRGTSLLLVNPAAVQRFTVGDPGIAEVVVVSPTEMLINGKGLGSTSLIIWEAGAGPKLYSLEVTIDTPALERYLQEALTERIEEAKSTGAQAVVTACPYCEQNLSDPIKRNNQKIKLYDLLDLMLQSM